MPKVSPEILATIQEAYERYVSEVESSDLTPESKLTYLGHAQQFVRWLDDDFEPGETKRRRGIRTSPIVPGRPSCDPRSR